MAESEARASFAVDMVDGVTPAAESAASAIKKLQSSIDADTKSLNAMNKAMKSLKQAATPDVEAMNRLQKSIDGVKSRIAANQTAIVQQGGNFRRSSKDTQSLQDKLAELSKTSSILPGPLSKMIGMLQQFAGAGGVARIAAFALAAGIVAIGFAAGKAVKGLTDFAISAANARRNELLMLEASTKLRTATSMMFGLAADKAADMQAAVDQVAASVSIGRDKVAGYAAQLERAGVRGANLKTALSAVSTAASGWGEEQASQTLGWAASLALTGGNVQKLADRVKNQIGGVVQKKMLSAEVQAQKLAESQAALFAGVNIEPLLKARKAFNDLFSQATSSGQALKRLLGGLVDPFIRGLEWLARAAKITMQELIIAVLRAENVWLKFRLYVKNGTDDTAKRLRIMRDAWNSALKTIGGMIEWVLGLFGDEWQTVLAAAGVVLAKTLVPVLWSAATAAWGFAGGLIASAAPIIAAVAGVWLLIKALKAVWDVWNSDDPAAAAVKVVDGFVDGLANGIGKVVGAFTDLAKAGMQAFTGLWEIKSPSKVMAKYGKDIAAGLDMGIEVSKPATEGAMKDLASPPTGAPGTRSGGGVTIGTLNVTVGAGGSPSMARDVAAAIKRELETVLQTVAMQRGAPAT